jgi:CMP-N,N'-diacetyllegionaminic acid synthase
MDYKKVMTNKLKLALIPARAGSKSIVDKNIVDLDGKPLVNWSIEVALNSKLFDVVCVSTDSSEIATIAKIAGAEVPFLRPTDLSDDRSNSIDVIFHCLEFYQNSGVEFNSVTLLQPTSPFRKNDDLINSLELFKTSSCKTLISVQDITEFSDHHCYSGKFNNNFLELTHSNEDSIHQKRGSLRQDNPRKYWRNGSIYIFEPDNILIHNKLLTYPLVGFEMPWQRSININNYSDLELARFLVQSRIDSLYD